MYTPVAKLGRNSLGPMARCKIFSDAEMRSSLAWWIFSGDELGITVLGPLLWEDGWGRLFESRY